MSDPKPKKATITLSEEDGHRVQSLIDLALRSHGLQIADQVMPLHARLKEKIAQLATPN